MTCVDDLKENIDAAIKVGMKGFVYHQNIQELEKYIQQIHVEYNKLAEANRKMNNNNAVIRVELLFKVLDKANFFPKPFVKKCVLELEDLLTIPDQEEEEEK